MPIFAKRTVEIPTEDILTWAFSGPSYDRNRPVSTILLLRPSLRLCLEVMG